MKEVLSSAAEAELGALFHNSKEACPLPIALTKMGHPQNATSLFTPLPPAFPTAPSSNAATKPSICGITEYTITFPKVSLLWCGGKEKAI
jgi:hypothetical protein